jgi:hypothetical protein
MAIFENVTIQRDSSVFENLSENLKIQNNFFLSNSKIQKKNFFFKHNSFPNLEIVYHYANFGDNGSRCSNNKEYS